MISVVIPAHNEKKVIRSCLESFTRQDYQGAYEIILVDNASTDGTAGIAAQYRKKLPLRIIRQPLKGRGMARATGFAKARGSVILSIDADCIAPHDWVRRMTRALDNDFDAIGGSFSINSWKWYKRIPGVCAFETYQYLFRYIFDSFPISGANFGVRKNIYDKCGGFDRVMDAAEDVDLGRRISRIGTIGYKHIPVDVNMRRFNRDPLGSLVRYLIINTKYFLFHKHRMLLSDIR
jgi:glycosyltransferase involved in cell wall biosynthesis